MSDFLRRLFLNNPKTKWPPRKLQLDRDVDAEEAKVEDLSRDEWRRMELAKFLKE